MRATKFSPAKLTHARASLAIGAQGSLRLGVVADTHSRPHPRTNEHLEQLAVDAILHAGDIGDLSVLDDLARVAPVLAVRGNIDERANHLPDALTIELTSDGDTALTLLLLHIAVAGPRLRADAARVANEVAARLVVCGHSHVPFIGRDRGLTIFNPGSIGPRRLRLPIVFGLLEIADGKLSLRHFDCESGEPWVP